MDELDLRKNGFRVMPDVTMPSGCYVLMRGGEVMYVGVSKNVYGRLYQHEVARKRFRQTANLSDIARVGMLGVTIPFNHVLVKFCPIHEARIIEAELIHGFNPKYNTVIPELIKDEGIDIEALAEKAGIEWKESEPWRRSSKDWSKAHPPGRDSRGVK